MGCTRRSDWAGQKNAHNPIRYTYGAAKCMRVYGSSNFFAADSFILLRPWERGWQVNILTANFTVLANGVRYRITSVSWSPTYSISGERKSARPANEDVHNQPQNSHVISCAY